MARIASSKYNNASSETLYNKDKEEMEDTKGVIIIRTSKKDRKYNDQKGQKHKQRSTCLFISGN